MTCEGTFRGMVRHFRVYSACLFFVRACVLARPLAPPAFSGSGPDGASPVVRREGSTKIWAGWVVVHTGRPEVRARESRGRGEVSCAWCVVAVCTGLYRDALALYSRSDPLTVSCLI